MFFAEIEAGIMSQDELLRHQQSLGQLSQVSMIASTPRRPLSLDVSSTALNSPKPPPRSATTNRATTLRRAALMLRASHSTASLQTTAWPIPSRSQSALVLQAPPTPTTLMPPPASPCCCCGHPDPTALNALAPRQYARSAVINFPASIIALANFE